MESGVEARSTVGSSGSTVGNPGRYRTLLDSISGLYHLKPAFSKQYLYVHKPTYTTLTILTQLTLCWTQAGGWGLATMSVVCLRDVGGWEVETPSVICLRGEGYRD